MTNLTSHPALVQVASSTHGRRLARRAAELAVTLAVLAVLTGAWLAIFTVFVDFAPPRPS